MYKVAAIVLIFATLAIGAWWLTQSASLSPQPQANTQTITLYYYNPSLDQGPGGPECSEAGLVGVEREIAADAEVLDVLDLLMSGELSSAERAQGIETEFPLPGVTLTNATEAGGVLTLTFADPQNKTSGGACRVAILWHQIERTAREFTGASQIRFMPEELFQP